MAQPFLRSALLPVFRLQLANVQLHNWTHRVQQAGSRHTGVRTGRKSCDLAAPAVPYEVYPAGSNSGKAAHTCLPP